MLAFTQLDSCHIALLPRDVLNGTGVLRVARGDLVGAEADSVGDAESLFEGLATRAAHAELRAILELHFVIAAFAA
jgi:hypothetical protein